LDGFPEEAVVDSWDLREITTAAITALCSWGFEAWMAIEFVL
jgi:hypothetical protein